MDQFPLHRFHEFFDLTPEEIAVLDTVRGVGRRVARHETLRRQGDPVEQVFVLQQGWVLSCIDLPDGQRQVVKVHLPGDMMGMPSMALERAAETLVAVTPAVVGTLALNGVGRLFREAPRLAATLFLGAQQERIFLMDRMTSIGRMPAVNRLAAFLLHIHDRLAVQDRVGDGGMDWPLTQPQVADVLGLTAVHVNRMFHELDERGLIRRGGPRVAFPDLQAIRDFAGTPRREWSRNPAWI